MSIKPASGRRFSEPNLKQKVKQLRKQATQMILQVQATKTEYEHPPSSENFEFMHWQSKRNPRRALSRTARRLMCVYYGKWRSRVMQEGETNHIRRFSKHQYSVPDEDKVTSSHNIVNSKQIENEIQGGEEDTNSTLDNDYDNAAKFEQMLDALNPFAAIAQQTNGALSPLASRIPLRNSASGPLPDQRQQTPKADELFVQQTNDQGGKKTVEKSGSNRLKRIRVLSLFRRTQSKILADAKNDAHKTQVTVLGARGVGKSAILNQFLFHKEYKPTVDEFYIHTHHMADGSFKILHLIDTAGPYEFPAMHRLWIEQSSAFVVVYNVGDQDSFNTAVSILDQVYEEKAFDMNISLVLVGNKADVTGSERVPSGEARAVSEQYGCLHVETSAKHRLNIDLVFRRLLFDIVLPKELISTQNEESLMFRGVSSSKDHRQPVGFLTNLRKRMVTKRRNIFSKQGH